MTKQQDNGENKIRIILAGGGSGGSIAPLLAMADKVKEVTDAEILVIGTKGGPEKILAESIGFRFKSIQAGKLRRYFSFSTLLAPFQSFAGFISAGKIIKEFKADIVIGAGAYVSVPVGYAAWSLGKKVLIHQQDLVPSLSNVLLAPVADKITVSLKDSLKDFHATRFGLVHDKVENGNAPIEEDDKVIWTGNPVNKKYFEAASKSDDNQWKKSLKSKFGITTDEERPILFVTGGGTGANGLNLIVRDALPDLLKIFEIIHSTGIGKSINFNHEHYHQFEFIKEMPEVFAISDIVVSRAGMSAISELSVESKTAVIIPMPDSHQEKNALYLHKKDAAMIYAQELLSGSRLVSILTELLYDTKRRSELEKNISELMPRDASQRVCNIILNLCQKNTTTK